MKTLTFNYAGIEIYIPREEDLLTFVGILTQSKIVKEENSVVELQDLAFELTNRPDYIKAEPFSKEAVEGREKTLKDDVEQYRNWWTDDRKKVEKLTKELNTLKEEKND